MGGINKNSIVTQGKLFDDESLDFSNEKLDTDIPSAVKPVSAKKTKTGLASSIQKTLATKTNPVNSGDSKLIKDTDGVVKSVGDVLAEKQKADAQTPEEVEDANRNGVLLDQVIQDNQVEEQPLDIELPVNGQAISSLFENGPSKPSIETYGLGRPLLEGLDENTRLAAQRLFSERPPQKPIEKAIEQLGVHDYFPDINHQIAVGSYSRKTLGSGNIYVAGGGILPVAVIDARRRAIEAQAKERQDLVDKIKSFNVDTAPQFNEAYNDLVFEKTNEYYDALEGQDPSVLMDPRNPLGQSHLQFRKQAETVAKEIADTDSRVAKILSDNKEGKYVPIETLRMAAEWSDGKWKYIEDYLNGDKKVSDYNSKLQSFDNLSTLADDAVKRLQESGPEERPTNLLEGIDPLVNADNIQQAIVFKPGTSYDKYIQGVSKFYDGNKIRSYVDELWKNNNTYKGWDDLSSDEKAKIESEGKASLASMILNQLTSQVSLKQELKDNDNLERAELALKRARLDWEKDQSVTKYSYLKNFGDATKGYVSEIMSDKNLTPQQREQKLAMLWKKEGNYNPSASAYLGTSANQIVMTKEESGQVRSANSSDFKVRVKNSKGQYVVVSLRQIGYDNKKKNMDIDRNSYEYKQAVKDYNNLITYERAGGAVGFKSKNRFMTVGSVTDNGKVIPWSKSGGNGQMINLVHSEVNSGFMVPKMENGVQKVNPETGEPMFETVKFSSRLFVTDNLDHEGTQIGFDTPMQTTQAAKNPNVEQW